MAHPEGASPWCSATRQQMGSDGRVGAKGKSAEGGECVDVRRTRNPADAGRLNCLIFSFFFFLGVFFVRSVGRSVGRYGDVIVVKESRQHLLGGRCQSRKRTEERNRARVTKWPSQAARHPRMGDWCSVWYPVSLETKSQDSQIGEKGEV